MEAKQPLVQGNVAPLHDGFHGDGEILAARGFGAPIDALALRRIGVTDHAAMRANRTPGPQDAFKHLASLGVVTEVGSGKDV